VIGDPVNLASRLEDLNKTYQSEILISQQTYELARYEVVARRVDWTTVKGREEPVAVYELLALRDEQGEAPGYEWVRMFERAVTLYDQRRWHEAAEQLRAIQELRPGDPPTRIYLERCEERIAAEPRSLALAASRATPGGE
jgi:adenylate cyclase